MGGKWGSIQARRESDGWGGRGMDVKDDRGGKVESEGEKVEIVETSSSFGRGQFRLRGHHHFNP